MWFNFPVRMYCYSYLADFFLVQTLLLSILILHESSNGYFMCRWLSVSLFIDDVTCFSPYVSMMLLLYLCLISLFLSCIISSSLLLSAVFTVNIFSSPDFCCCPRNVSNLQTVNVNWIINQVNIWKHKLRCSLLSVGVGVLQDCSSVSTQYFIVGMGVQKSICLLYYLSSL